jgi:ketosteroid isomerase-like protein
VNRILLFVVLTSLVVGCQTKGDPAAASMGHADIERIGRDLAEQHTQGLLKKDTAALERLWADELTFVNPRGQLLTKANRLENLRSGSTAFKSINVSEMATRSVGKDAAVTTSRVAIAGQYSGAEGSGDYRVTMVWGQPQGRWQLFALHMTKIEK